MAQSNAVFLEGNLFRHISVMSLTSSLGLMAVFLVDFVDMVFISMLGNAELAAAVGYAGAILFFTSSFGIGMAIAAGALVARALGAGAPSEARMRATTTLSYGFAFGAVFAGLVWVNLGALVTLMGASGETHDLAVGYLRIIIPSLPLLLIGMVGGAILRAHGAARRAMYATIIGGLVNAVLDPILIFGLDLELTGAALASVAARVAIAATALAPIRPFLQNRAAEQPDHIGPHRLIHHRFLGQRDAFVKAGQLERVLNLHRVQHVIAGEILDPQRHLHGRLPVGFGQGQQRLFRHLFEGGKIGRGQGAPIGHRV